MEEKIIEILELLKLKIEKEIDNANENDINIQFRFGNFENIAYINDYVDAKIDILFNVFKDTNLDICFRKSDKVTEDLIKIIVEKINSFAQLKESENTIWNTNFSHYKFVKSN